MKTFTLTVSSPDGNVFKGEIAQLILRGAGGDLAVMAGHIPFVTPVKPGVCRIFAEDGSETVGKTAGGLLTVSNDGVTLLSDSFEWDE